ncbi:glucose 1-dehydrogenase [Microbacterium resistens]
MGRRLEGKVALVTGGASGMGAAHARAIVAEGGSVALADISDEAAADLAAELGPRAISLHLDVTDAAQWEDAVAATESAFGSLNVLVNNAGILTGAPLEETTEQSWDTVMAVNAKSVFLGMRAALPALKRATPASIINISSVAGLEGIAGMHAYTASKFAVRGVTKSAALELAGQGVRVNSVHPGNIRTPMTAAMLTAEDEDTNLLTRAADPAEVSAVVVFLASDESSFATGAEFVIDGGISAGKVYG